MEEFEFGVEDMEADKFRGVEEVLDIAGLAGHEVKIVGEEVVATGVDLVVGCWEELQEDVDRDPDDTALVDWDNGTTEEDTEVEADRDGFIHL